MKMIFKNYMVLRIAVVFWSLSVLFVGIVHAQLSNQSLKGLKAKTIDEVLALPDSEIDLSTAILLINKKVSKALYQTDIEIENYIDKLDDIAVAISRKIENQKDPEKIVKIINSYFFQELNFSFVIIPGDYKSHLLSSVIDRKKGYCLTLSIVYLSIAERLGLPFYGVAAPGHFFIRYADETVRINVETSGKGKSHTDDWYVTKRKIPKNHPLYLKNVGKRTIIAYYLNDIGEIHSRMNLLDEAILLLQQSIAINPNLALPHINLGVALEHKGLLDKAIGEYKKAIAINPNSSHAHWCLGSVYYKKKGYFLFRMLDEAIEEFKKALAIDPNNAAAHNNLAVAYQAKNDYKLAIKHVDIATELGLTVHPALLKRLKPYR